MDKKHTGEAIKPGPSTATMIVLIALVGLLAVIVVLGSGLLYVLSESEETQSSNDPVSTVTTTTTADATTTAQKVIVPTTTKAKTTTPLKRTSTTKKATTTTTTTTTTATSATTQSTTTQTAAKTTRTATDAEIEAIYQQVYYAYYPEMEKMTTALEDSIEEKTEEMESLALNHQLQLQNLQIKYANMGLLNSGAYQSAVQGAKNTYSRKTAELSKEISDLKADLEEVEKHYENLIIEETAQKVIEFELSTEQ